MRPVVCAALALAFLVPLSVLAGGTAPGEETEDVVAAEEVGLSSSVGTRTSHLVWSSTVSGDFAVRMVLDFDAPEACLFYFVSGGHVADNAVFSFHAHDEPGRTWTAVGNDMFLGAHAANVRLATGGVPTGMWIAEAWHYVSVFGEEHWMFTGFDLTAINHPLTNGKSVTFDLECSGPFTITAIEGGKKAIGFMPSHLTSGAGARLGSTTTNVLDGIGGVFGQEHVAFRYHSDSTYAFGQLSVNGPTSGVWTDTGDLDAFLDGDPGVYNARLTRAAVESRWDAVGIFAGLQSVASLDEAAAL